jgi:deazaflavin-dependent oxidoreductase (nitroreductase family)
MTEAKLPPSLPQWMKDHADLYLRSGGKEGHMYKVPAAPNPVSSLLLTTTGRKSGEKWMFPLFYGTTGNSYFVIASKGGAPEHPGWYRNMQTHPEVEIQVGTKKMKARARTATGEERKRLWAQAVSFYPPYADYEKRAGSREIPVVVLDPVH